MDTTQQEMNQAYEKQLAEALANVEKIKAMLEAHSNNDHKNWGHVGDLQRYNYDMRVMLGGQE